MKLFRKLGSASLAALILVVTMAVSFEFVTQPTAQAQAGGYVSSMITTYAPATSTLTATCTTTACPTFPFNGMCTASVQLTGTATSVNVVVKVSPDNGTTYYQISPVVYGLAANGTVTSNAIAAKGLYYFNVPTMNKIRFEAGTLSGGNLVIRFRAIGACLAQTIT